MPMALLVCCLIACNGHRDPKTPRMDAKAGAMQTEAIQTFAADSGSAGWAGNVDRLETDRKEDQEPDPKSPQATRRIHPTSVSPQANPDWDKKIVKTAWISVWR